MSTQRFVKVSSTALFIKVKNWKLHICSSAEEYMNKMGSPMKEYYLVIKRNNY